jgi:hypothetical protein
MLPQQPLISRSVFRFPLSAPVSPLRHRERFSSSRYSSPSFLHNLTLYGNKLSFLCLGQYISFFIDEIFLSDFGDSAEKIIFICFVLDCFYIDFKRYWKIF